MADENTAQTTTEEAGAGTGAEETQTQTQTTTEETGQTPKETESPEAKEARLQRELDRHYKKHPELKKQESTPEETKPEKSSEFDYGQKAFLIANGIKEADEIDLVKKIMGETGKDLENVLGSTYFQTELKTFREDRATASATPSKTKRSAQNDTNSVDYWIAKGELPPNTPENQKLRADVVNARMKNESSGSPFTDNPVVK